MKMQADRPGNDGLLCKRWSAWIKEMNTRYYRGLYSYILHINARLAFAESKEKM
ncbi:MAG: hypothetical protein V4717_23245 [Bacteroidota bacterium]